jgi:hypothetical protein
MIIISTRYKKLVLCFFLVVIGFSDFPFGVRLEKGIPAAEFFTGYRGFVLEVMTEGYGHGIGSI